MAEQERARVAGELEKARGVEGTKAAWAGLVGEPRRFVEEVLGRSVWRLQGEILDSVAAHDSAVVKSCHASGKTWTAAAAVLWWVHRYADGIAITTAPTWTQVERLLWGEIRKAHGAARAELGGRLLQTEWRLGPGNYALGLSTDQGVRFQGFHGRHVLIVLDEAVGVRPDIWEAIEGIRAGGQVRVLAIGNPTSTSGPFFEAFHAQRARWRTFTISAFDTPNLENPETGRGFSVEDLLALPEEALGQNPRPYLVTRAWVKEKYREWGPSSDLYRVRVLGEFPAQGADSLIALAWVEAAQGARLAPGGLLEAGLDPARFGEDESALALRRGDNVVGEWAWQGLDTMQSVGQVNRLLAPFRSELHALKVDVIGLGAGVADRLREQGWPVVDVNVALPSGVSGGGPRFANLRAQYWWALRERFREGAVGGPLNERTQAELVGVRYTVVDSNGAIGIEKKEEARKRGVRSPNRGDALMLAFAPTAAPGTFKPKYQPDGWGQW